MAGSCCSYTHSQNSQAAYNENQHSLTHTLFLLLLRIRFRPPPPSVRHSPTHVPHRPFSFFLPCPQNPVPACASAPEAPAPLPSATDPVTASPFSPNFLSSLLSASPLLIRSQDRLSLSASVRSCDHSGMNERMDERANPTETIRSLVALHLLPLIIRMIITAAGTRMPSQ